MAIPCHGENSDPDFNDLKRRYAKLKGLVNISGSAWNF